MTNSIVRYLGTLVFALFVAVSGFYFANAATSIPVGKVFQHVYHATHHCGAATGTVHWTGHTATQRFQHCEFVGHIQVIRPTPTPQPQPTATPAPSPRPTPQPQPTATPTPTVGPTCTDQSTCLVYVVDLINAERARHAIAPLAFDPLESAGTATCVGAQGHADHMASMGQISHDQFPADICHTIYSAAGENVGEAGPLAVQTAIDLIQQQMLAEPYGVTACQLDWNHHCNEDDRSYSRVGVGIAVAGGIVYISEDFTG